MATGLFDELTVKTVINILKEGLKKDDSWEKLRVYFRIRLVQELGDRFMCGVDEMGKSFFINVFSEGKKNILIGAKYQEMVTLKDIAAYTVAKEMSTDDDLDCLGIPISLHEDVRNYIGCTRSKECSRSYLYA